MSSKKRVCTVRHNGNTLLVMPEVMEELGLREEQNIDENTFSLLVRKTRAVATANAAIKKASKT